MNDLSTDLQLIYTFKAYNQYSQSTHQIKIPLLTEALKWQIRVFSPLIIRAIGMTAF